MATLKDLETIIEPLSVEELTALFTTATIEKKKKEIAVMIADRDAATRAADEAIALAQAELVDIQLGKATIIKEVITP